MPEKTSPSLPPLPGQPSSADGGSVKPSGLLPALRLVALDAADLPIIAANLQDAVGRVRDMAFVPRDQRFAMLLNRFDWSKATQVEASRQPGSFERRRCALRFEHVRAARVTGFVQKDRKLVLSLLTISFEQTNDGNPDGFITLMFAGGGAIRLEVECIEAELTDIGTGWRTPSKPDHPAS